MLFYKYIYIYYTSTANCEFQNEAVNNGGTFWNGFGRRNITPWDDIISTQSKQMADTNISDLQPCSHLKMWF